jgi:hypothetical protein
MPGPPLRSPSSLNDLYHSVRPRIDQHRPVVHNGVAIVTHAVFGGHLMVGYAARWQHRTNPYLLLMPIGSRALLNYVLLEAWPVFIRETADDCPADRTDYGSNRSSDNRTAYRARGSTSRRSSGLSMGPKRKRKECESGKHRDVANCH